MRLRMTEKRLCKVCHKICWGYYCKEHRKKSGSTVSQRRNRTKKVKKNGNI